MPMCVSSPNVTRLVRLNLAPDTLPIDSLVTIPTPNATYKVAAICPSSQTIIFSQPATLRCLRWSSCSFWKVILTEETDEELVSVSERALIKKPINYLSGTESSVSNTSPRRMCYA